MLLFVLSSCHEKDGGWPPFSWQINNISDPTDIKVDLVANDIYVYSYRDNGELRLFVKNYYPWLKIPSRDSNVTVVNNHSHIYPWGRVEIEGHLVTIVLSALGAEYIGNEIVVPLDAGDIGSIVHISRLPGK